MTSTFHTPDFTKRCVSLIAMYLIAVSATHAQTAAPLSSPASSSPQSTDDNWVRLIVTPKNDYIFALQLMSNGDYIIAANTLSYKQGVSAALDKKDKSNIWLARFDAVGNPLWQRVYGGSGYDTGTAIQPTPDGGCLVIASTESFGAGKTDVWLLKLNKAGDVEWQKTYGGKLRDYGTAALPLPDDGFIILSNTHSFHPTRFGGKKAQHTEDSYWVFRIDKRGTTMWQRSFVTKPEPGKHHRAAPKFIAPANDAGKFYVGGTHGVYDNQSAWMIKLDGDTGTISGSGNTNQAWSHLIEVPYACGTSFSDIKPNRYGYLISGEDVCSKTASTSDSTGNYTSETYYFSQRFIAQFGSDEKFAWAKLVKDDYGNDFDFAPLPDGTTMLTVAREMGAGLFPNIPFFESRSTTRAYIAKLDSQGNFLWRKDVIDETVKGILGASGKSLIKALPDGNLLLARTAMMPSKNTDIYLSKLPDDARPDHIFNLPGGKINVANLALSLTAVEAITLETQMKSADSLCFVKATNAAFTTDK